MAGIYDNPMAHHYKSSLLKRATNFKAGVIDPCHISPVDLTLIT